MGDVLVTLKAMPEGLESDLETIEARLKDLGVGKFNSLKQVPIAFGLIAIEASYVVGDSGGVSDSLEKAVKNIEGVKTAEVIDVTLV